MAVASGRNTSRRCAARTPGPLASPANALGGAHLATMVDGAVDHDVIHVGRRDGRFRAIMLVVERAPVELYDVVVTFANGERFEPRTRLVFGPDTRSRTIDLPGGARVIQRVDFRYGNVAAGARAKVELWGR